MSISRVVKAASVPGTNVFIAVIDRGDEFHVTMTGHARPDAMGTGGPVYTSAMPNEFGARILANLLWEDEISERDARR
jgi:hypothetical protein